MNETLKKSKLDKIDSSLKDLVQDLANINIDLWEAEDLKRKFEKDKDFGEKFIKVSRVIHFKNDERAKIKHQINIYTNSKINEVKDYVNY